MASLGLIYVFCRVHLGFHSGFQLRCHLFFLRVSFRGFFGMSFRVSFKISLGFHLLLL